MLDMYKRPPPAEEAGLLALIGNPEAVKAQLAQLQKARDDANAAAEAANMARAAADQRVKDAEAAEAKLAPREASITQREAGVAAREKQVKLDADWVVQQKAELEHWRDAIRAMEATIIDRSKALDATANSVMDREMAVTKREKNRSAAEIDAIAAADDARKQYEADRVALDVKLAALQAALA